jgi:hypothetical protein
LTQSAFWWWSHRARWTEARVVTSTGSPQVRPFGKEKQKVEELDANAILSLLF